MPSTRRASYRACRKASSRPSPIFMARIKIEENNGRRWSGAGPRRARRSNQMGLRHSHSLRFSDFLTGENRQCGPRRARRYRELQGIFPEKMPLPAKSRGWHSTIHRNSSEQGISLPPRGLVHRRHDFHAEIFQIARFGPRLQERSAQGKRGEDHIHINIYLPEPPACYACQPSGRIDRACYNDPPDQSHRGPARSHWVLFPQRLSPLRPIEDLQECFQADR